MFETWGYRGYIGLYREYGCDLGFRVKSFPKLGVPSRGPYEKDYGILGSILGFSYFGKLPHSYL